jgi:hypothetical protein
MGSGEGKERGAQGAADGLAQSPRPANAIEDDSEVDSDIRELLDEFDEFSTGSASA